MARTMAEIADKMDKTLESIKKLEALITKRERTLHGLYVAGHMADQFGDIGREESLLAKNKQRLAKLQATYDKLTAECDKLERNYAESMAESEDCVIHSDSLYEVNW